MKHSHLFTQAGISAVFAWLSMKLGVLLFPLGLLVLMMMLDYFTGMLASKAEAITHPEDPSLGWSSRRGMLGILKKLGYLALIAVGVGLDQIIVRGVALFGFDVPGKGFFGLAVTIWLVLNEMLSIVENVGRMGAPVPAWLARCVALLKGKVDQIADQAAEDAPGGDSDE